MPLPGRTRAHSSSASATPVATTAAAAAVFTDDPDDSAMTDFSKISLGQASGVLTSTPNMPTDDQQTDEQKTETAGQQTDEQKTETAAAAAAAAVRVKPRACTHFSDSRHPEHEVKEAAVAELILGHPQIMVHLLQALSYCHSNTVAMMLSTSTGGNFRGNLQDTLTGMDPLSVGDGIFHVLSTLNKKATDIKLVIRAVYQYVSLGFQGIRAAGISKLSEPLLWFFLRVLDCDKAINIFLEMGGVEVICRNLVSSNQRVINTSPSLLSTLMQYLSSATKPMPKKLPATSTSSPSDSDCLEGLQNFAPLGTINSASPSASPADVLIQASPPHRRARSAAWSYHFYPDEAWVDLTISLPCAVLLREVHIQPHLTSLATCPGAVTVEASRDGLTSIPLCAPLQTSGLTCIKIQLLKPEVVTVVTIRLHKPKDSTTIGLSQIMLNGYTTFSDNCPTKASVCFQPNDDFVAKSGVGWLRLLHHCLTSSDACTSSVASAAAPTANLMLTCTALLTSAGASVYAAHIEAVLLHIGLYSTDMGLLLIDNLLRSGMPTDGAVMHGRVSGLATDSTIDLLYQLGVTQDSGTATRVRALCHWLADTARGGAPAAAPAHVHCIATVLWHSHEMPVTYPLASIVTKQFLRLMYDWSSSVASGALKRSIDWLICSLCYIQPDYFTQILDWLGLTSASPLTDDVKEERRELTDDTKAERRRQHLVIDESRLMLLATAAHSTDCRRRLLDSGFVAALCHSLYTFCTQQLAHFTDVHGFGVDVSGGAAAQAEARHDEADNDKVLRLSSDLVAPVLKFLAEISKEVKMKDWLGSTDGSVFWSVLLHLLCTTPSQAAALLTGVTPTAKAMSAAQRAAIENETVEFFMRVISCHPPNQHQFAQVLCDVIRGTGFSASDLVGNGGSPLCGFMRRLFLQVLLEDEKLVVTLRSASHIYKASTFGSTALSGVMHHLRCGAGHKHRTLTVSLNTTCAEIMTKISDAPAVASQMLDKSSKKGDADDRKDNRDVMTAALDQISQAAGLSAQEKRDKSPATPPPRPPSRRGRRPPDSGLLAALNVPVLHLCHSLLPGQPLPSDMTLSQLLTVLYERGLSPGQSVLQFSMKLKTQKTPVYKADKSGRVPSKDPLSSRPLPEEESCSGGGEEERLLSAVALPSGLQVFAGVGGLALLAEHLPLVYPEVSRQAPPHDANSGSGGSKEPGNSASLGHDWVTVESSEDMYEEIYEPIPPSGQSVNKHSTSASASGTSSPPASMPPHSLVAFGLFLRLPGYAEVLLKQKRKARCLLRLMLGVTDDGEGGHILQSPVASSLPTLPFSVLQALFDSTPLSTDDGVLLRRMTLDIGCIHLILACLSVLSHHAPRSSSGSTTTQSNNAESPATTTSSGCIKQSEKSMVSSAASAASAPDNNKASSYWAKGTGFGTGSTISSWDAEQALQRQRSEEEHVTGLLQVLASYINPSGDVPKDFSESNYSEQQCSLPAPLTELLSQSCLVPAISSYLRNDSVLDMARHIPLYHALLLLLRGMAVCAPLVALLLPLEKEDESAVCIVSLLDKIKSCVDTYASRLKTNKGGSSSTTTTTNTNKSKTKQQEEEECEGLAQLIPDIQQTARIVQLATNRLRQSSVDKDASSDSDRSGQGAARVDHSLEDYYINTMKELQFDTFEMVRDDNGTIKFMVSHHYESNVKAAGDVSNPGRARRLAQEAVTLSTSLPLSYNSSVFVRCDEDRLDVMKVLITGPSDTPYSNGCFEFDIYFPQDYPNSPPLVNLETTGNQSVRFNPNLYNDGKVCLSVLNTWHGRPEEKWNSQTSSFLQVLVSIQSLILVAEPYFNEPGYERSRNTPTGMASSREYDANIRQATVKWAMLEMIKNPSPAFKEVIRRHFWLKKDEICAQVEEWINELKVHSSDKRTARTIAHSCVILKRHYHQLKEEFAKMKPPSSDVEDSTDDDSNEPLADLQPPPPPPANTQSSSVSTPVEAAELLASSTVDFALSAAVQSVLNASGALDSSGAEAAPVTAESGSGLVYVDDTAKEESKTDTEKSETAAGPHML